MKQSTIKQINEHLAKARAKHPRFAPCGPMQVISIATEELGELSKEVTDWVNKPDMLSDWGTPKCKEWLRAKDEALDLIAVMVRLIEGD